ncbi:MAG: hypothetical protein ACI9JN_001882 [Bacteroidia bacterium]|jgi:hypothetical protein
MRVLLHIIVLTTLFFVCSDVPAHARELDSTSWFKMAEKYDYPPPEVKEKEKDKPVEEKNKTLKNPTLPQTEFDIINVLLYVGIFALFVLLLFVLIKADIIKINHRKVQLNPTYDVENPEELVLTELERELNAAALENNYNRCLRYEYLLLLEKLQSLGLIRWHKYNTNGEYLNQLLHYKHHKRIRNLTMVYEYYWYGEHVLSLPDYEKVAVTFIQLKEEMGHE